MHVRDLFVSDQDHKVEFLCPPAGLIWINPPLQLLFTLGGGLPEAALSKEKLSISVPRELSIRPQQKEEINIQSSSKASYY